MTRSRSGIARAKSLITGSKRDALESVPATVVPGLASLVGLVLIGHLAGPRILGLTSLAWVTANFGSSVVAVGPAHAALRAISSEGADLVSGHRRVLVWRCGVFTASTLVLGWTLLALGSGLGAPVALAAPWIAAQSLVLFEGEVLRAERRFVAASILLSTRSVLGWGASAIGAAYSPTLPWTLGPHIAVSLVFATWLFVIRPSARPSPQVLRDIRGIGTPIARLSVASYGLGYVDRYIVHWILGPSAVGVYTIGYTLGQGAIELVMTPVTTALLPRIVSEWVTASSGPDVAVRTARRAALFVLAVTCVAAPAILLLGEIGLLDPASHEGALGPVAALVAAAVGIHSVSRVCYALLLGAARSDRAMRAFWQALALMAVAAPLFTWAWGIVGTAVATVVSYAFLASAMAAAVGDALGLEHSSARELDA